MAFGILTRLKWDLCVLQGTDLNPNYFLLFWNYHAIASRYVNEEFSVCLLEFLRRDDIRFALDSVAAESE